MNSTALKPVKVEIDARIAASLDDWRDGCPTINRSALVNMIIKEWIMEQQVKASQVPTRLRQS